jgi:maleamate amidohydrolase
VLADASAGLAGHLSPGARPALVCVDIVGAYFEPGAQLYMGANDCLSAATLLAAAREAGILVLHTKVSYIDGGLDGGVWFKKVGALASFVGDSALGEIMPEVTPRAGEPLLVKQYASAFFGTSLASTLTSHRIDVQPHDLQAKYAEVVSLADTLGYLSTVGPSPPPPQAKDAR